MQLNKYLYTMKRPVILFTSILLSFGAVAQSQPQLHRIFPNKEVSAESPYRLSPNFGKTIAVFGGSLSVLPESDAAKQIWADLLGAEVTTYGVGGAGFSIDQGYSIQRQVDTAGVFDIYVLWASTNDFFGNRQCGSPSDYTPEDGFDESGLKTQCGGINYCIKRIYEKNPNARIYFFTSLRCFSADAVSFEKYVQGQKLCCSRSAIPVLDQYSLQGVNEFNYKLYYMSDKLHMNREGYRRIAYLQADFLAK